MNFSLFISVAKLVYAMFHYVLAEHFIVYLLLRPASM